MKRNSSFVIIRETITTIEVVIIEITIKGIEGLIVEAVVEVNKCFLKLKLTQMPLKLLRLR